MVDRPVILCAYCGRKKSPAGAVPAGTHLGERHCGHLRRPAWAGNGRTYMVACYASVVKLIVRFIGQFGGHLPDQSVLLDNSAGTHPISPFYWTIRWAPPPSSPGYCIAPGCQVSIAELVAHGIGGLGAHTLPLGGLSGLVGPVSYNTFCPHLGARLRAKARRCAPRSLCRLTHQLPQATAGGRRTGYQAGGQPTAATRPQAGDTADPPPEPTRGPAPANDQHQRGPTKGGSEPAAHGWQCGGGREHKPAAPRAEARTPPRGGAGPRARAGDSRQGRRTERGTQNRGPKAQDAKSGEQARAAGGVRNKGALPCKRRGDP